MLLVCDGVVAPKAVRGARCQTCGAPFSRSVPPPLCNQCKRSVPAHWQKPATARESSDDTHRLPVGVPMPRDRLSNDRSFHLADTALSRLRIASTLPLSSHTEIS